MSQKSILITGCSSGIGRDAALTLRERGWRVFASCRKEEDCAALREAGFESPRLDYRDPASVEAAAGEALDATGGTLDALYNNGAIAIPAAVEDLPRAALAEIMETNLAGPHHLTTLVLPAMRRQGHGRIVNCSSVLGFAALRWRGAYVASKHALEGLTDTLRIELHGEPIHVSLIEPGLIATPFADNSRENFERWIDWRASARIDDYRAAALLDGDGRRGGARREAPPSRVTAKIVHALESPRPRARYRVTALAHVACALKRVLPSRGADRVARMLS